MIIICSVWFNISNVFLEWKRVEPYLVEVQDILPRPLRTSFSIVCKKTRVDWNVSDDKLVALMTKLMNNSLKIISIFDCRVIILINLFVFHFSYCDNQNLNGKLEDLDFILNKDLLDSDGAKSNINHKVAILETKKLQVYIVIKVNNCV